MNAILLCCKIDIIISLLRMVLMMGNSNIGISRVIEYLLLLWARYYPIQKSKTDWRNHVIFLTNDVTIKDVSE